ncbi:MAG: GNAT family N-acetyltransferase [Rubrobacter sp.]
MTPTKAQTPTIRRYEPDDQEAVWKLHNDALYDVGAHLGNGPWDEDLGAIESVYLEDGGEFLVGVQDGHVVAMGALRRTAGDRAGITRMRVAPGLQGRGIGQTLLDALHRRAAELGYATLHLDTTVHQTAARRLYERNGYREVGRGPIGPFDCVYYEGHPGA